MDLNDSVLNVHIVEHFWHIRILYLQFHIWDLKMLGFFK